MAGKVLGLAGVALTGLDAYDATMGLIGTFIAPIGAWFDANLISMAINGKTISEKNIQDGIDNRINF